MDFLTVFLPLIPVLVSCYGLLKKQRFFFLLGYALYSLIVIPAEIYSFVSSGENLHLIVAAIWIAQLTVAFPNKLKYDGTKLFKIFAFKTFLALIIINLIGIFVVLNDPFVNNVCIYYHGILAFLPLVADFILFTNKMPVQKN
tara:strand:- start:33 stop:461 length:429 start_codon:yes stop_codon:yes gene_type:complete